MIADLLTPSCIKAKVRLSRVFLIRKRGEYDRLCPGIEGLQGDVRSNELTAKQG